MTWLERVTDLLAGGRLAVDLAVAVLGAGEILVERHGVFRDALKTDASRLSSNRR